MKIPKEDLKITAYNGPTGGQFCGMGNPSVTITHISGTSVTCNLQRSQLKNKELAMTLIELALGI